MSVKVKKSPLTLDDRIVIEIRYRYGYSVRDIAKELNRNPSTIYREIDGKPHTGIGKYIARASHIKALDRIKVYFANPYTSHEREVNGNANRLLRRFFPKGTD